MTSTPPAERRSSTASARRPAAVAPVTGSGDGDLDPPLVLTLRFDGERWALEASHDLEVVGPVPVPGAAVASLASAAGDRAVTRLVRDSAKRARSRLGQRAAALRRELAEVESTLDGLPD